MKFGFIGALAIAATMFFAGCADECKDIVCANGECVDGACVCDAGYEGTLCDAALNAKFTGSYSNTETCNPSGPAGPYTITLNPKSGSATEVNFVGLWEVPSNIVMGTVGTDGISFTIERQVITNSIKFDNKKSSADAGLFLCLDFLLWQHIHFTGFVMPPSSSQALRLGSNLEFQCLFCSIPQIP